MKYIFIVGGVCSSIGKGICAANIGLLLTRSGYKVSFKKIDPYLNNDSGTLNPNQHGEVFVTKDGKETDLDIGNYERFLNYDLDKYSSCTFGYILNRLLDKEKKGKYLGKTVQFIPHVTKEIIKCFKSGENTDFKIVEIGGTIGDIEQNLFLESIREMIYQSKSKCCIINVSFLPKLNFTNEFKTKPVQASIRNLQLFGLIPNFLILRSQKKCLLRTKKKLNLLCGIKLKNIYNIIEIKNKYEIPIYINKKTDIICNILSFFNLSPKKEINLNDWTNFLKKSQLKHNAKKINIVILAKYLQNNDTYLSLFEALKCTAITHNIDLKIVKISTRKTHKSEIIDRIKDADGVIAPGGFGKNGFDTIIHAIQYIRENNIPFLGICYGFQLAIIEYYKNVLKMKNATSPDFEKKGKFIFNNFFNKIKKISGTMILGELKINIINKKSIFHKLYNKEKFFYERHRHRFNFNMKYYDYIKEDKNVIFGCESDKYGYFETFELKSNKFFVGVQFHPEYKSRPLDVQPIFFEFLNSCLK